MDALNRANEIRALRAQLKRDLKAGRVPIGALLLDPPAYLETAKIFDMLLAVPKYGRVKATKILNSCRVSPSKTFGGLSERQRAEARRAPAPTLTYLTCAVISDGPERGRVGGRRRVPRGKADGHRFPPTYPTTNDPLTPFL